MGTCFSTTLTTGKTKNSTEKPFGETEVPTEDDLIDRTNALVQQIEQQLGAVSKNRIVVIKRRIDDGTYTGQLDAKTESREGRGTYHWDRNDIYGGFWKNNRQHGIGRMIFSNGDIYKGDWRNGTMSGNGRYTWTSGKSYSGGWENARSHGKGKEIFPNGRYYEGEYLNGERHGKGVCYWPTGEMYEGDWLLSLIHI